MMIHDPIRLQICPSNAVLLCTIAGFGERFESALQFRRVPGIEPRLHHQSAEIPARLIAEALSLLLQFCRAPFMGAERGDGILFAGHGLFLSSLEMER